MLCPFCQNEVDRLSAWRGTSGNFYCSEFCADEHGLEPKLAGLPRRSLTLLRFTPDARHVA